MNYQEFERIARAAEQELSANTATYKRKLVLFSWLGYLAVFGLLGLVFLLIGGSTFLAIKSPAIFLLLIKKKLIVLLLVALWVLLKSLWVRFDAPSGYVLKKKQAPAFFMMLDRLRKSLKAPKIHQVIVTPELNAAIVQSPRLGIFGWQKNTVIIGLELMLILDEQEMESVIAHELGHLSGNHSKFNGRIYRARTSWTKIMQSLDSHDSWANFLTRKFFDWYAPRFAAYSFALARHNEYEADAAAMELTSQKATASALVHTHAIGPLVDKTYWEGFYEQAKEHDKPQYSPFNGLVNFLKTNELSSTMINEELSAALKYETDIDNTHPSLKDRLAALKAKPEIRSANITNAAQALLGDFLETLIADFDQAWLRENQEKWLDFYQQTQEEKAHLAKLEKLPLEEMTQENTWELAAFTEKYKLKEQDPLPLYRFYMHKFPDDMAGQFSMGRILLARNDEKGLALLKESTNNAAYVDDACQIAYHFLMEQDRVGEAEEWKARAIKQYEINDAAHAERNQISKEDTFVWPDLGKELLEQLSSQVLAQEKVKGVWLAQKEVKHYPEHPVFVVAIKLGGFGDKDEKLAKIMESLEFPHLIFGVSQDNELFRIVQSQGVELRQHNQSE